MRIAIVGAGAVGSAYGARLARAGTDVVFVDPWREHVEAIARDGLAVELPDGEAWLVPAAATTDPAAVAGAGAVLVVTKAFATATAAAGIAPHLDADAIAVTVQNGLGNDAALAAALGPSASWPAPRPSDRPCWSRPDPPRPRRPSPGRR